jgi:hypothetical protein
MAIMEKAVSRFVRTGLKAINSRTDEMIVHFSFHKNLTVYYGKVARQFSHVTGRQYRHFNSFLDNFHIQQPRLDMASVNNHHVDIDSLERTPKASRFIRDPRDLIVSGYFYHKRGAEAWCHVKDPTESDWTTVNGTIPTALDPGESFKDCLQRLDLENGLLAEIEFRRSHFAAMRAWAADDRVLTVRYEDLVADENRAFAALADHYGFSGAEKEIWLKAARRNSAQNAIRKKTAHVRDPRPQQWREVFPEKVAARFHDEYGDLIEKMGYDKE